MNVAVGCDHGGFTLKREIVHHLLGAGHEVNDVGCPSEESVDYPEFAERVCAAVLGGQSARGILICGTGIGMAIAANRHPGIRAAVLHDTTEARLTRAHNNANIACFGARTIGIEPAFDALRVFLSALYQGGHHDRRLAKLDPGSAKPGA